MKVDAKFEYKIQKLGKTDRNYCMLSIKAPEIEQSTKRKPLNLVLVVDRSGSMKGEKITSVKKAVNHLVQNLTNEDILSIITYNQKVEVLHASGRVFNKDSIKSKVNSIFSNGRTNLSDGWEQGFREISENLSDKYVNRIILLTDGLANEGMTDSKELAKLGRKFRKKDVRTTTMGVGVDFNEELLKQVADESSGNYYYMADAERIQDLFQEEIGELLNMVAQDIELVVEFKNGVELRRVLTDYAIEKTGENEYTFALDDAFSNDEKIIMLRIDYPVVHQTGVFEVCTCMLKYRSLHAQDENAVKTFNILREVGEKEQIDVQVPDDEVLSNVALFTAADARRRSYQQSKSGMIQEASETLFISSAEINVIAQSLEKMDSQYSSIIMQESQSLEQDTKDIESSPEKAQKDIMFKSRSSFRRKTGYKKRSHEDEDENSEDNEGKI
ncbi:MAG: VWA domain-containing protein [Planctomycetes bacterium]|nr:VWA domain-containing protein [Planctomycetota bacterium]